MVTSKLHARSTGLHRFVLNDALMDCLRFTQSCCPHSTNVWEHHPCCCCVNCEEVSQWKWWWQCWVPDWLLATHSKFNNDTIQYNMVYMHCLCITAYMLLLIRLIRLLSLHEFKCTATLSMWTQIIIFTSQGCIFCLCKLTLFSTLTYSAFAHSCLWNAKSCNHKQTCDIRKGRTIPLSAVVY